MTLRSSRVIPRWGALPVDALSRTAMGCLRLVVMQAGSTSNLFHHRTQALGACFGYAKHDKADRLGSQQDN
ncbi:hypothetical protein PPUN109347_26380 [Pseudomonas putida]|nr:hypothetical protein PPUN109347_26380 [Pseudomonas putida]